LATPVSNDLPFSYASFADPAAFANASQAELGEEIFVRDRKLPA
jgi:hypothetical protein